MQVETYEVEEIKGELGTMAADSESLEIIEKLGLNGQRRLAEPKTATRQPYRQMTQLERNVFAVLFPEKTKLATFSQSPIPLRVLQVAAHANELGMFKRLEVWHPASAREKDPVLVGVSTNPEHSWLEEFYILARWGDALLSFDELAAKAQEIWTKTTNAKLLNLKAKIDGDISRIESIATIGFSGGQLEALEYHL